MGSGDMNAIRSLAKAAGEFAVRLWYFPKPLVTACTGHAFKIGMTETRMDMMITPWVLEPLSQRLSKQHWVASVVQARVYDPDEAPEVGFLDEVLPEGGATDRAMEVAAGFPARAHAANKLMTRAESIEIARADVTEL